MRRPRPVALTVAGVDSGGGAGVAADLKTFEAHGVWATLAVTAVTAQNTLGIQATEVVAPEMVHAQMASVAADIGVDAAKTGMLATAETVETVAAAVRQLGIDLLVVDPVLAATSGESLLAAEAVEALRDELLPLATVVTPNMAEATALVGFAVGDRASMERAARQLLRNGPEVVLVTGGHLEDSSASPDCLAVSGDEVSWIDGPRLASTALHGGGCVLSAAVCAELARGMEPRHACLAAKRFVEKAIAAGVALGAGPGPVDPGWERAGGLFGTPTAVV